MYLNYFYLYSRYTYNHAMRPWVTGPFGPLMNPTHLSSFSYKYINQAERQRQPRSKAKLTEASFKTAVFARQLFFLSIIPALPFSGKRKSSSPRRFPLPTPLRRLRTRAAKELIHVGIKFIKVTQNRPNPLKIHSLIFHCIY